MDVKRQGTSRAQVLLNFLYNKPNLNYFFVFSFKRLHTLEQMKKSPIEDPKLSPGNNKNINEKNKSSTLNYISQN